MKNYLGYAWIMTLSTIVLSVGAHYIPQSTLDRFGIHSINILSDLNLGNNTSQLDNLDGEYGADHYNQALEIDGAANSVISAKDSLTAIQTPSLVARSLGTCANPIIDHAKQGSTLEDLFAKMRSIETLGRPLRIGVLGDSFIEGDILTSDLREMLQERFGGGGVGFVPISSQTAAFRITVAHTFDNWTSRAITNTKADNFLISGHIFTPTPGSSSYINYRGGRGKRFIDKFNQSTLVFTSTAPTSITITVNDTTVQNYTTIATPQLQKLVTRGQMSNIHYKVDSASGFTAYGAMLENEDGVSVDNYSIRGHSGTALSKLNTNLNRQFAKIANYDLLILQYGLNVASASVLNYVYYQKQMLGVISHIKECYPNVPILLMSVSDRSTRLENSEWVTMPGIIAMVETQKQIAAQSGVAFWDTYAMMQSLGGMSTFVANGWAAKDYTHIGPRGGKKVASSLFQALMSAKQESDIAARNRELYQNATVHPDAKFMIDPRLPPQSYKPNF